MADIIEIKKAENSAEEINTKIETFLALKAQIEALTKQQDEIKTELSELAKNNDNKYTVNNHSISVSLCKTTSIDKKALMEAHPKLAAKFLKETEYWRTVIK